MINYKGYDLPNTIEEIIQYNDGHNENHNGMTIYTSDVIYKFPNGRRVSTGIKFEEVMRPISKGPMTDKESKTKLKTLHKYAEGRY